MADKFKTTLLTNMLDKHVGKRGTERREAFENELSIELGMKSKKQAPKVKLRKYGIPKPTSGNPHFRPQRIAYSNHTLKSKPVLLSACPKPAT